MFSCYVCKAEINISSEKEITQDLRFHEVRDGLKAPILCKQPNCKSGSFAVINTLVRHFKQFHSEENSLRSIMKKNIRIFNTT